MDKPANNPANSVRLITGFIAGFLATLTFHQFALTVLYYTGIAPSGPFSMSATSPFGVPAVISLSFWGGVWGILYTMLDNRFPDGFRYWITSFLFGAVPPSLVAFFIVFPLKGLPVAGGWKVPMLVTVILINGTWGVGTGILIKVISALQHNLTRKEKLGTV
jgi:hypothetical protein